MPVVDRSNNRILPANARASDVAEKAINEIMPVQQERYYDAFRVQGIRCVLYNHLKSGRKCNCQSSQKQLNSRLGLDGKASPGTINEMLTGELEFNVTPYSGGQERLFGIERAQNESSPLANGNKYQGTFDIAAIDDADFADSIFEPEGGVGDNGPVRPESIDDLAGDFDANYQGFSDASCAICFGSGFVGGYSPFNTYRRVLTVADVTLPITADLDTLKRPWQARSTSFQTLITIPRGVLTIDSFRVWNGHKAVNAAYTLDGNPVTTQAVILANADGKQHLLTATFDSVFTHFEMQYNISSECAYFEFPKRPKSSDTSKLEQMEPFQIIMSPNIPQLDSQDIITESQQGKTLIVQNVSPWQSRKRQNLGWECTVRVLQPMELYRILPKRGRVLTKDRTTSLVRDNASGPRRT